MANSASSRGHSTYFGTLDARLESVRVMAACLCSPSSFVTGKLSRQSGRQQLQQPVKCASVEHLAMSSGLLS